MAFVPREGQKTYNDYMQDIPMSSILEEAGYKLDAHATGGSKKNLVYRSEDSKNEKIIVNANTQKWFDAHASSSEGMLSHNAVYFIKTHRDRFIDNDPALSDTAILNKVFRRLDGNTATNDTNVKRSNNGQMGEGKGYAKTGVFNLSDYEQTAKVDPNVKDSIKPFYCYFGARKIDPMTQRAFAPFYSEMKHPSKDKSSIFTNLCFPFTIPGSDEIVGFDLRSKSRMNGSSSKLMAPGTDARNGMWIANKSGVALDKASKVIWFEGAYDAMAYYQLKHKADPSLEKAVYVSTGGQPGPYQLQGMLRAAPQATHIICFDNDQAGNGFVQSLRYYADQENRLAKATIARDMRPYIEACQYKNGSDILPISGKNGNLNLLPQDVQDKVAHYRDSESSLDKLTLSGMATQEEIDKSKEALAQEKEDFTKFFVKRTGMGALSYEIKTEREIPREGFKDWNDDLKDQVQQDRQETVDDEKKIGSYSVKVGLGYDADGDGIEEEEEEQAPVPEEKKHNVRYS